MITRLSINNYALFQEVNINFKKGFTVISGETGSGKSIMLDALALLLGKRIDRMLLLGNNSKCIIEAEFTISEYCKHFFKIYDLDFDTDTVVRREINTQGKSRAFINDTPVRLNVLNDFGSMIVEVFSQNKLFDFKDKNFKFKIIDQLANSKNELSLYREELKIFMKLEKELLLFKEKSTISSAELDFIEHQYNELNNANLNKSEKENLENNLSILENSDDIANIISEAELLFNDQQGIISNLSIIQRKLKNYDVFKDLYKRIDSSIIELNDINQEICSIKNTINFDSDKLTEIRSRLDFINKMLYKHKLSSLDDLIDLKNEFFARIELSSSFELLLKEKNDKINQQKEKLLKSLIILNSKRDKILDSFCCSVESILHQLGLPEAKFCIEKKISEDFHNNGTNFYVFKFSANKGVKEEEISKVASGGELARLMLAIKYITAQNSHITTLIFDEIDSGVSGEIASLMGDMMREISHTNQLISVTHLPQIASKADKHLKVSKRIVNENTISVINYLNKEGRISEIAKLLSGKEVTQAAINNAVDLLNQ